MPTNNRRNAITDDEMLDDSDAAVARAMNGSRDERLIELFERVERLEEEKKGIADDIKDVFSEMKAVGYDTKIARQCLRLRKMNPDDRKEMDTLLATYKAALGMD